MSYLILSFASIAIGLTYVVNKKLSREEFNPAVFAFALALSNALLAIPLLFIDFRVSENPLTWVLTAISAAFFGVGVYFSFKAYKVSDASIVSLVHKLSIVFSVFMGILILKENYSFFSYLGLFLILLGNIFILYEGKRISLEKGIFYAFLMAFFSAVAAVLDKRIIQDFSPLTYVFVNNMFFAATFLFRQNIFQEAKQLILKNAKLVFISSFLNTGSWAAYLLVLRDNDVSRVFPAWESLSLIVPVVMGIIFLGEKDKLWQKLLGMTAGAIGIAFLALK